MKKHIWSLVAGGMLLLSLAGCRETNEGSDPALVTPTPAATPYHTENALEKGIDKANDMVGQAGEKITDGAGDILEDMGRAEQKAGSELKNAAN